MNAETLQARVGSEIAGERLDRFLTAALAGFSRSRLKNLVESGQVSLEGTAVTDPAMRVKPGQVFTLAVPPPENATPEPQAMALDILFEDEHLLVLDKPAGLVVHPAPGNPDGTLVNALLAHCGASLAGIGGVKRPGIVHRLDKGTSGLMVVAKNEAAHRALARDFAAHAVTRAYQAVVWGVPQPKSGEISGRIGRNPRDRKKMAVVRSRGKPAVTRYKVLKAFGTQGGAGRMPARHRPHPSDPRPHDGQRPPVDRRCELWEAEPKPPRGIAGEGAQGGRSAWAPGASCLSPGFPAPCKRRIPRIPEPLT